MWWHVAILAINPKVIFLGKNGITINASFLPRIMRRLGIGFDPKNQIMSMDIDLEEIMRVEVNNIYNIPY
jgi:hypothetical protein